MPAAGVEIELYEVHRSTLLHMKNAVTNVNGRTDQPLLSGGPLRIGTYELRYRVADYFKSVGAALTKPRPFVDVITFRFSITEPETLYHIPLTITPFSYSIYRGS
jgi:hydroxyisourate hydrolase